MSAKEYVLVCSVKLVHNTEVRLITKIVGITLLTLSESSAISHTGIANRRRKK